MKNRTKMKNNHKTCLLMLALCAAMLPISCSDSEEQAETARTPVVLTSKVYSMDEDEGSVLRSGEKFGVFMLEAGTDQPVDGYANVLYTADDYAATGYLIPDGEPMYYPSDGRKVDIVAYYPYEENVTAEAMNMRAARGDDHSGYIYQMNLKDQQKAKTNDFLHGPQEKDHSSTNAKVQLQMRPVVARIKMTLEAGAGMTTEQLNKLLAHLNNIPTIAWFDLVHGTFLQLDEKEEMEMKKTTDTNSGTITIEAIIFPGAVEEEVEVVLKDTENPEQEIHLSIPLKEVVEHTEENTEYNILAKVTPEGIDAELIGTSPIYVEDWQYGDNVSDNMTYNATELITDGTFENLKDENLVVGTGIAKTDHTWFAVKNKVEGNAALVTDATQGKILTMNFSGSEMSWYRSYIGHTMSGGNRTGYYLQFKARAATKGAKMQTYIRVNKSGNYFFVLDGANTAKACAARTFSLTEEWKTYTIAYDLSKVVNTINTPKVASDGTQPIANATADDMASFFAAFVPIAEGVDYYIDDVTMIEIE